MGELKMRKICIDKSKLKIRKAKEEVYIINTEVHVDDMGSLYVQIITASENLITHEGLAQKIGYDILEALEEIPYYYPDPEPDAVVILSDDPITSKTWEKYKIKEKTLHGTNKNSNVIKLDDLKWEN